MGTVEQVSEKLAGDLEPGESVLAATKAHLEGGVMRLAKSFAADRFNGMPGGTEAEQQLAHGAFLVVTDRRMIIMRATSGTFRPDRLVFHVPLDELVGVDEGTKRVMLVKVPTITVHHRDGTDLAFEAPKVSAKDAAAVAGALRSATTH